MTQWGLNVCNLLIWYVHDRYSTGKCFKKFNILRKSWRLNNLINNLIQCLLCIFERLFLVTILVIYFYKINACHVNKHHLLSIWYIYNMKSYWRDFYGRLWLFVIALIVLPLIIKQTFLFSLCKFLESWCIGNNFRLL